jgi:hypothetical protein
MCNVTPNWSKPILLPPPAPPVHDSGEPGTAESGIQSGSYKMLVCLVSYMLLWRVGSSSQSADRCISAIPPPPQANPRLLFGAQTTDKMDARFCKARVIVLTYRCLTVSWWPPLWSSGQSSWLQTRRPGFDSRHYQKKSSVSGTGSTQPREYNWGATW